MKRLLIALACLPLLASCSTTDTVIKKDGVCYNREVNRIFGGAIVTTQDVVDC